MYKFSFFSSPRILFEPEPSLHMCVFVTHMRVKMEFHRDDYYYQVVGVNFLSNIS